MTTGSGDNLLADSPLTPDLMRSGNVTVRDAKVRCGTNEEAVSLRSARAASPHTVALESVVPLPHCSKQSRCRRCVRLH